MNKSLNHSFPKSLRLRTRQEYQRIQRGSQNFVGRWIIVDIRQSQAPYSKLGITTTRRYGKAHDRNRFKRLVREAFRLSYPSIPPGLEIHVRPRMLAKQAKMANILIELMTFVDKLKQAP